MKYVPAHVTNIFLNITCDNTMHSQRLITWVLV